MSIKSKAWQKQLRKEEKVIERILEEASSACPNGCLHIVFQDRQLQFLHLPVEAMTRYQKFLFMKEYRRRPEEGELKTCIEAFIQEMVVDSKINIPEECDGCIVFIAQSSARIADFLSGKELWVGSFETLQQEMADYFHSDLFPIIPWFQNSEHLREKMDSIEVVLAAMGIRVVRNRTDDLENIRLENLNYSDEEACEDE